MSRAGGIPAPSGRGGRQRQHTGLARFPGVDDPSAEWEYEGRVSADGARHDYHHADGRVSVCHVRYMTRAEIVEAFRRHGVYRRCGSEEGRSGWCELERGHDGDHE